MLEGVPTFNAKTENNSNSNPAEVHIFFCKIIVVTNENKQIVGHLKKLLLVQIFKFPAILGHFWAPPLGQLSPLQAAGGQERPQPEISASLCVALSTVRKIYFRCCGSTDEIWICGKETYVPS